MDAGLERPPVARWRVVAVLLFVAGAVARLAAYAQHRSLWYDEAALGLNVVERGFMGLLDPLDNLQVAPPLFLWAERAIVLALGPNEWVLRAIPLAAGIATAPMMWRFARRVIPPPVAILAVALVALSPSLVQQAAQAKPYAVDAFVTLVLCERAHASTSPGATRRTWLTLGLAGVLALTMSTPAAFILGGAVAYLAVTALVTRDRRLFATAAATGLVWATAFLGLLWTVFRAAASPTSDTGRFMQWYWAANFLTPEPPGLRTKASAMMWAMLTGTFFGESTALPGATTILVLAVVAGGLGLLAQRRYALLALLTVPTLAACAASALHRYPIAERLMLFAAPLSAMLIASAALIVRRLGDRRLAWVAGAMTAAVSVVASLGIAAQLRSTAGRQESRALVQAGSRIHAAGTPVWVSGGGEPAWRFYSGDNAPIHRSAAATEGGMGAGTMGRDVLIGAWYNGVPERIVTVVDDTAALSRPSPWSEREAARLRGVARPCALVFLSHIQPGEAGALLTSASRLGGRVDWSRRAVGAELHHLCFDSTGSAVPQ